MQALLSAKPSLRLVHQTGERDLQEAQAAYLRAGVTAEVSAFIHDMPAAFAQADLLLCRSGASTVGEIAAAGKPAIFVPFPRAADDHQMRNARAMEQQGAALVIAESQLSAENFVKAVTNLLADPVRLRQMGERARAMAHPRAAAEIAEMAVALAGGQSRAIPA